MRSSSRLSVRLFHIFVLLSLGFTLLIGLCAVTGGLAHPVHAAATITVSTCDESHLDAAIAQANSDNANDTIIFSCSGDILLTSTLSITGSMTIDGSGQSVTLDGNNSVEVLDVSNVSFTLNALTVAHGSAFDGGGLYDLGGTVNISRSTFANNSATNFGGGLETLSATVNISRSTFTNNSATSEGGGLDSDGSTVNITNSTFANNLALSQRGGGLFSYGPVSITNSTFANNSAGGGGGGIVNLGSQYTPSWTMSITNSTIANNSASDGGGLWNYFQGKVSITNSTIANNSATINGGIVNQGTVTIGGSIVAENTGGDCHNIRTITDKGYNLSSDSSCGFTGPGDLQNTNPHLAALANNGGPTQTMALQQGSPAIDAVLLSATICPSTDQRGDPRPDGTSESACDMGAYESNYRRSP